jgi:hypothetical protein
MSGSPSLKSIIHVEGFISEILVNILQSQVQSRVGPQIAYRYQRYFELYEQCIRA